MEKELNWIQISLRVFLGGILIWAGIAKLLSLSDFVDVVSNYEIAPFDRAPWDMWLGYTLPSFEVLLGLALIIGYALRGAIIITSLLTVSFLAATFYVKINGINIECGCFGEILKVSYWVHIALLSLMLIACLGVIKSLRNVDNPATCQN